MRLDSRDVIAWLNEPMPVILILYDARKDRAYWVDIQACLAEKPSRNRSHATITVYVPIANEVNEEAIRSFRDLRGAAVSRFQRIKLYEE